MISDPCVVRLGVEGGGLEIFGHKSRDGTWRFTTRGTSVEITADGNDAVTVSGVPECKDLADCLWPAWVMTHPWKIHPELRGWFRERYEAAVAALPDYRKKMQRQFRDPQWQRLFASIPPDRWSEEEF